MPYTMFAVPDLDVVVVEIIQSLPSVQFQAAVRELEELPSLHYRVNVIVDFRRGNALLSAEEMRAISRCAALADSRWGGTR